MLLTHHTPDGVRRSRHQSLSLYGTLESGLGVGRVEELTEIARLARLVANADGASVTLLPAGRQVVVAGSGDEVPDETPEQHSVCAVLLEQRPVSPIVISDLSLDPRFAENPFVDGRFAAVRGFASAPLIGHERVAIGTLCVWSAAPGGLTRDQTSTIEQFARAAVKVLDDHRRDHRRMVQRFPARVVTPDALPAA